jgi:putative ABC transport system permease protein
MAIPLKYNLRSLLVRRTGTAMAIVSVAATVAVFVSLLALAHGLENVFALTGHPLNIVVIRLGSQVEGSSSISVPKLQTLKYLPGVARYGDGQPLVSPELLVLVYIPRAGGDKTNVTIRGTTPAGLALREQVRLVDGRMFRSGLRELVVSRTMARRFNLARGSVLNFGRSDWTVVGVTEAGGSAYDSELWADVGAVADEFNRRDIYSSVLLRAADPAAAEALCRRISDDRQLQLQARLENDYFREQMRTSMPIKILGTFVAIIMAIGSCFAAMNAMYAAVAYRTREIATLRVLGFSRRAVMLAFVLESALLAAAGGVLGCLLALPIHGLSTGTMNFYTFAELSFHFRLTPALLARGLLFAVIVGVIGGLLPARLAARRAVVDGLRG